MLPTEPIRSLTPSMRALLVAAGALVFLAGVQLFLFPLRTDRYFAWTISPPMTAVFLGSSYWSSLVFEWSAARRSRWADARIAVPTVFVFTTLTLIVTLAHLGKFHFGPEHDLSTRVVTWAWLAIYLVVPVLMAVLFVAQMRRSGGDAPRSRPLAGPVRALIAAEAALLLGIGVALIAVPERSAGIWPWTLTPLTARAIGAWCVGLGVAAAHALWENDAPRLRPAAHAFVAFGLLQGLALLRYGGDLDWSRPAAFVYLAFLISAAAVGGAVLLDPGERGPRDLDSLR